MGEPLRLALPAPYAPINVIEDLDLVTGQVRYAVTGRRVAGVFVVEPDLRREEPVPTRVCVRYGDGPERYHRDEDRTDRPTINGIDLVGATVIDPDSPQPWTRWRLNIRRPTGRFTSTGVPDKTGDYAAAIIGALLGRWRGLPQRHDLMLATARGSADRRIAEVCRWDLEQRYQQRETLMAEIARYEGIVAQLQGLSAGDGCVS